jgi:hypothetical protein
MITEIRHIIFVSGSSHPDHRRRSHPLRKEA